MKSIRKLNPQGVHEKAASTAAGRGWRATWSSRVFHTGVGCTAIGLTVFGCAEPTYSGLADAGDLAAGDAGAGAAPGSQTAQDPKPNTGAESTDEDSPANTNGPAPVPVNPEDSDDGGGFFNGGDVVVSVDEGPEMSTDGVDPADQNEPPLVSCSAATANGEEPMIDDFEDGDRHTLEQDGRNGDWYLYNSADDNVAQVLEITDVSLAPAGGALSLHTAGSGFEWAGIGVGLRWDDGDLECVYDASSYEGITFWGRGSGTLRFTASVPETIPVAEGGTCADGCWNNPGSDVVFSDQWQQYVLPFADMIQSDGVLELDAALIRTFQFEAGSNAFDFWIDGFAFYSAAQPPPAAVVSQPDPGELDGGVNTAPEEPVGDASVVQEPVPSAVDSGSELVSDGGSQ